MDILLGYSSISEEDKLNIAQYKVQMADSRQFECITIDVKRIVCDVDLICQIFIHTNAVGNFSMKDIITNHRENIWRKYVTKYSNVTQQPTSAYEQLSQNEICDLIKGSKLHKRIIHHKLIDDDFHDESSDNEDSDPNYDPLDDNSGFSDSDECSENEEEEFIDHNISIMSTMSTGSSCIKQIMVSLKGIDNKHKWRNESIDSLLHKYMSSKNALSKLFVYKMDIINNKVQEHFGKSLFNAKDNKKLCVKKMYSQLKQMPQLLNYESSSDECDTMNQPKPLFELYKNFILSGKYPKEYLTAAVCKVTHMEIVHEWESKSPVPISLDIPLAERNHIIFSYPERSSARNQLEMRTFDYTHILNNLRYHVSNGSVNGIQREAFLKVSEVNHEVLQRSIVEDKLDRQNCSISR